MKEEKKIEMNEKGLNVATTLLPKLLITKAFAFTKKFTDHC